jgi:hypothetical protein
MQEQQDYARWSFVLAARGKANEDGRVRPHPKCLDLLGRMRKGNLQARPIKDAGGWRLTELTLELTQPDEHIDVLPRPLHYPCTRTRPCRSSPSPVCFQIMIAVRSLNRRISQFSDLPCQNSRYKDGTTWACNLAFSPLDSSLLLPFFCDGISFPDIHGIVRPFVLMCSPCGS